MSGQLQVRMGSKSRVGGYDETPHFAIIWHNWTDVPSPGWLYGYILPTAGLVYEFRYAPEGEP